MYHNFLKAFFICSSLTACGGSGGGGTGSDVTRAAFQNVLDDLASEADASGEIDLTNVREVRRQELPATVSFDGIIALDDGVTANTVAMGKLHIDVNVANDNATGSATDFKQYEYAEGTTLNDATDILNLPLSDSYSGQLTVLNGNLVGDSTSTGISADLDGTLTLVSSGAEYVVESEIIGGIGRKTDDRLVFVGEAFGTIDGPNGVFVFDDFDPSADFDSAVVIATQ